MTDRPIPFSGPMVQALLDGRKTQTRRVFTPEPPDGFKACRWDHNERMWSWTGPGPKWVGSRYAVPRHTPGDRLWVKEAHWAWGHWELTGDRTRKLNRPKWRFVRDHNTPVRFKAPDQVPPDRSHLGWHKRPGMFMFRRDSRLTLTVTDVRVQRVQDMDICDGSPGAARGISDALAEGVMRRANSDGSISHSGDGETWYVNPVSAFRDLWNTLNAKRGYGWDENPWVSATTFNVHHCNIDQMECAA